MKATDWLVEGKLPFAKLASPNCMHAAGVSMTQQVVQPWSLQWRDPGITWVSQMGSR